VCVDPGSAWRRESNPGTTDEVAEAVATMGAGTRAAFDTDAAVPDTAATDR